MWFLVKGGPRMPHPWRSCTKMFTVWRSLSSVDVDHFKLGICVLQRYLALNYCRNLGVAVSIKPSTISMILFPKICDNLIFGPFYCVKEVFGSKYLSSFRFLTNSASKQHKVLRKTEEMHHKLYLNLSL